LYENDISIRSSIPICYYHVWDNDPVPVFNKYVYDSCDWVATINKLTHDFVKTISEDVRVDYIPHGVDSNVFHRTDSDTSQFKTNLLGETNYDYVIFANNVNIPRKQLPTLIESVGIFSSQHLDSKICLLMHNNPSSVSVNNLKLIANEFCDTCDVVFSETTVEPKFLNMMYNIADVTINIASNEGFGLSTLESVMAETPIIATDTGGLTDQMFHPNGETFEWAYPIKPDIRRLNSGGSVPYIYDDICSVESVIGGLEYWYTKTAQERGRCGLLGRNYAINHFDLKIMTTGIGLGLQKTINEFTSIKSKQVIKV
jgi:glycosyltransferase involved in cell wall biosynthesis